MKINPKLKHFLLFLGVVLAQVLVFDQAVILNNITPYIYPLIIILQPPHSHRLKSLVLAFVLGLSIDVFQNTGGMHASACLIVMYLRPQVLHFNFGLSYDYQTLSINNAAFLKKLTYVILIVVIHHFVLLSLAYFSIELWQLLLQKLVTSALASIVIIMIILQLIKRPVK